jgi:hypothetical protein
LRGQSDLIVSNERDYLNLLSSEAVERIIAAVKLQPRYGAPRLKADLCRLFYRLQAYRDLDSTHRLKSFRRLTEVGSGARRLSQWLEPRVGAKEMKGLLTQLAHDAAPEIGDYSTLGLPAAAELSIRDVADEPGEGDDQVEEMWLDYSAEEAVERVLAGLRLLTKWCDEACRDLKLKKHSLSPKVRLIAYMLPETFQHHFEEDFTITNTARGLSGNGFAFARSVLAEGSRAGVQGLSLSDETIRKYWKEARKGGRTRKRASESP